jgi:uncharacterized protein (DUF2345 family)
VEKAARKIRANSAESRRAATREAPAAGTGLQTTAEPEELVLSAHKQVTIRCGESSITLTAAGKIILRGKYIVSRSSGVQRIKGGSVQIN